MAIERFVTKSLELLDKERDAEVEETRLLTSSLSAKELERKGVCLLKLQLKSRRSGLYGRMLATFEPRAKPGSKDAKPELPSHSVTPGDIVGVAEMRSQATDKPQVTGIVSQVTSSHISVACDESQDVFELNEDELFKLTKLANDVTYRRLKATLNDLTKYRNGPSLRLIDTFFCLTEVSNPAGDSPITFVNQNLDESQREAVRFALSQREVAIIHGPPGTGKTTTVVELIVQAVRRGMKILATAPSNIAVDNLVERLAALKQRIVRIGHPARLLSHLQKYSLDAIVAGSEEKGIVQDVRADMQKVLTKMKKARGKGERMALKEEMKQLRREASEREGAATREVLSRADVVLVTLTSSSQDGPLKYLKEDHFDLVVIDECSQAMEAACWIGLLRAPRCVLAGDHLQLPPTILSKEAAKGGLEVTLMERLLKMLVEEKGRDVVRMLTTQYRMHQDIMAWASHQLYQDRLTAHASVAQHLLSDLPDLTSEDELAGKPLLLIDTAGCDLWELDLPEEVSKGNEGEADVVAAHVEDLIKMGLRPVDIAVIAPYNLQVDMLRLRLLSRYPDLEIKSVDGFQGREKEAVVISMVRSNASGEVGFLAEKRRINVAVTRARRHLAVVCDSETVSHDPFLKTLVDYMMDTGEVYSAHQYIQEGRVSDTISRPVRLMTAMDEAPARKAGHGAHQPTAKSKQQSVKEKKPLRTAEEKATEYRDQLKVFQSDADQTVLRFPPTLNSHDRMVVHEVCEQLGLCHISVGEGSDRYIEVSKKSGSDVTQLNISVEDSSLPGPVQSEGTDQTQEFSSHSSEQCHRISVEGSSLPGPVEREGTHQTQEFSSHSSGQCQRATPSVSHGTQCVMQEVALSEFLSNKAVTTQSEKHSSSRKEKARSSDSAKTKESPRVDSPPRDMSACSLCQKQILKSNLPLHELHCQRQLQAASASSRNVQQREQLASSDGGKCCKADARPKEKKTKKGKQPETHVQKAADVLKKVDADDFEGLIASITELDSKCAFKKCKTLTNTLGRHCDLCTRRFCLSHLVPEVHGCGQAAKEAARRVISRDGVLHQGSGMPNRKPNQAKRAHLEGRLEKKLNEMAGQRSRKSDKDKKGS